MSSASSSHFPPRKSRHRAKSLRKSALLRPGSLYPGFDPTLLTIPLAPSSSAPNSDDDASLPLMMRPSSPSHLRAARSQVDYAHTAFWGWIVLVTTWVVFVVGMGSVLGVWDWAWYGSAGVPPPGEEKGAEWDPDDELPIRGYYPALVILTGVVAWVWVVVAWVGMKYFKHARIETVEGGGVR